MDILLKVAKSEAFSSTGTAASLTLGSFGIMKVVITVETAPIRFLVDGNTPTASNGHLVEPGDAIVLEGEDISKFQHIRTTGTSATGWATFYERRD